MTENVFNEKVDYLKAVREDIVKRDEMDSQLEQMKQSLKKVTKSIAQEERSIQDEITSTIRKRKNELEEGYDDRLDQNRSQKKDELNKKEKKKNQKMDARVADETKHIKVKNRDLETDLKSLFKKNKVPAFCRSKFYYCMFMPSGIGEVLRMILGIVLIYLAFPAVVVAVLREFVIKGTPSQVTLYTVLIPAVWIIFCLIFQFIVYTKTKIKHLEVISEGRKIRDSIKANEKEALAIKNSISKDKDESVYDLGSFDQKIQEIDAEADSIMEEKKQALKSFEEETKTMIIDEINGRRMGALDTMKQGKSDLEAEIETTEDTLSDKRLEITNKYESCIGKEYCRIDRLDELIAIMEQGNANTVSEAITLYKTQKSAK